jgi:hypothetical protein
MVCLLNLFASGIIIVVIIIIIYIAAITVIKLRWAALNNGKN